MNLLINNLTMVLSLPAKGQNIHAETVTLFGKYGNLLLKQLLNRLTGLHFENPLMHSYTPINYLSIGPLQAG